MLISEVEKLLGIDRETVRYYITKGFFKPEKDKYGYRVYTDEVISQMKRVMLLRELGFSIADIQKVVKGELDISPLELESRKEALCKKREELNYLIGVCDELMESGADSSFDPEPYFRRHSAS